MGWKQQALGMAVAASLAVVAGSAAQGMSGSQVSGQSATGAQGQDPQGQASHDTSKFYKKAAMANLAEIELAQLGVRKAQDPQVKQFAQQMVDTHQRALDNLKEIAAGNVEWPTTLDEKHQRKHDELAGLSGAEFDRQFIEAMINAHEGIEDHLENYVGENRQGADSPTGTAGTGGTTAGTQSAAGTSGVERPGGTGEPRLSGAAYDWAAMSLREVRSHLEQAKAIKERLEQ